MTDDSPSTSQTEFMKYIGLKIYGYCDNYFDELTFGEKIIEAIGIDWVVARGCVDKRPLFAIFTSSLEMIELLEEWHGEWAFGFNNLYEDLEEPEPEMRPVKNKLG